MKQELKEDLIALTIVAVMFTGLFMGSLGSSLGVVLFVGSIIAAYWVMNDGGNLL
jgi:hypothetical protein